MMWPVTTDVNDLLYSPFITETERFPRALIKNKFQEKDLATIKKNLLACSCFHLDGSMLHM